MYPVCPTFFLDTSICCSVALDTVVFLPYLPKLRRKGPLTPKLATPENDKLSHAKLTLRPLLVTLGDFSAKNIERQSII